jgi:hypothetical protein
MSWRTRPILVLLLSASAGCGQSPQTDARSPADQVAFMERTRCIADAAADEKALAPILDGAALQGVQPLYSTTESGKSGIGVELRGAVVKVAALQGVTDVWLDRALECHGAKATLGHVRAAENDPFWLPDSTVDIDVRSAKDGFDVAVTGHSSADARQVLARASAFANRAVPSGELLR